MKIGVIGAGYVGLVTAACLAEKSNDVVVTDIDHEKLKVISQGNVPFYEPGLEELVRNTLKRGHLRTGNIEDLAGSEIFFVAVGTPQGETDIVNTTYIEEAAISIGRVLKESSDFRTIAIKSTVPPGTTRKISKILAKYRDSSSFAVVSNPEFLKEGTAIEDFRKPNRIIIGTDNLKAEEMLKNLYSPFMRTSDRLKIMDPESAELTKYAANAMLATRIAFINELSHLAASVGADIEKIRIGIGSDPRIGEHFLFPGPGYGGSCFPKDIAGLEEFARSKKVELKIVRAVKESNNIQRYWLADAAHNYFRGELREKIFAIWGAAFKPKTDDIRESSAIYTVSRLLDCGAKVVMYDPEPRAIENFRKRFDSRISYSQNVYDVLDNANALLIVTDWDEFKSGINLKEVKKRLREPVIIDARNLHDPKDMTHHGFDYISLGRKPVLARERLSA